MIRIAKPIGLTLMLSGLAVCFVFILPLIFSSNSSVIILTQIAITIIFALSYNMVLGQAGMLSFGHAVYMGIGGFAAVHVMNGVLGSVIPLLILPLFGGLFSLGVAFIVGGFSTRRGGISFAMISLGVVELVASFPLLLSRFFVVVECCGTAAAHLVFLASISHIRLRCIILWRVGCCCQWEQCFYLL